MGLIVKSITSCFGLGYLPKAPGTWGSLGAVFFWAIIGENFSWPVYAAILLVTSVFGVWAIYQQAEGDKSSIVIDEWVGVGITLSLSSFWWPELIAGFVLFRIFDIWKPLGIGTLDRKLKNAFGVMLDDVLAGLYAGIILAVLIYFGVLDALVGFGHSY